MSALKALIMGMLQGLTEFLPVSSSAHLKISKILLGVQSGEETVIFDLVCHLGTLTALLLFFKDEIWQLFRVERKKLGLLFLATLPLFPFYFLLKPVREWASQTPLLGFFLIATAAILFAGSRLRVKRPENLTMKRSVSDALWIGTLQACALIPGISRSASTISCAQVLGWEAKEAVRFSFLLSIPTVLGGNSLELLKLAFAPAQHHAFSLSACLVGFLASCSVGFFVIRYAIRFLEKGNLRPFAWYCLCFGVILVLVL